MPRLHGFLIYRFAEPGWVHPKGYRVDVVTADDLRDKSASFEAFLDDCAKRQEQYAELMTLDAVQCARYGHVLSLRPPKMRTEVATECLGHRHPDATGKETFCATRARLAASYTRTEERSVFVRIHLP